MAMAAGGTTADVLARHDLFRGLDPADRDALVALGRRERFRNNQTICLKGDPGTGMMLVLAGQVRISVFAPDGREVVLSIIRPGQVFGEMALLDGGDRSANGTALGECELLAIDRRDFLPFLERRPAVALNLLTVLCQRVRRTSEQVESVLFLDLPTRLARLLLELAGSDGEKTAQGPRIGGRLSQRELGTRVGASRESVNKQLAEWSQGGLVHLDGGAITLRNERELRDIAGIE